MSTQAAGAREFLRCATPQAWFAQALRQPDILLIDHAHCEKKAAATALSLVHRYVDRPRLLASLSRLAREELRHFEQVLEQLRRREIAFRPLSPSRYAAALRALVRTGEPGRLVDTLIVGAVIEARSCERFAGLADRLSGELATFYGRLVAAEARHFELYLGWARQFAATETEVDARTRVFIDRDFELISTEDTEFRFHSGVPAVMQRNALPHTACSAAAPRVSSDPPRLEPV